jgi:glycosyltransferase involved in cell wall biosynthesis
MPTLAGRGEYRRLAEACFSSQTYVRRELVVVENIRPVGKARNEAIRKAKGDVVIHWDDDDWSAPGRIEDQVRRLVETGANIVGYHAMLFYDEERKTWWRFHRAKYGLGTSFCYRRSLWDRLGGFPETSPKGGLLRVGEDNAWRRKLHSIRMPFPTVDAGELMWARIHRANTSPKRVKACDGSWTKTEAPAWLTAS